MAMKIVRFNCCGMDVHKNLVVATIGITDSKTNITEYFQRSFSTLNSDLYRLKDWLKSHHCSDVCMESTGKYWIPIFNILEDEINVRLTHPKYHCVNWKFMVIYISVPKRKISCGAKCLKMAWMIAKSRL